jgi:DNA-binding NarL/FixJ family response regulator
MRILIADDNERVRRGVVAILSAEPGWEICGEAADGEQAITMAQSLRPDLILVDVSMPGLNGLEVARRLRQDLPQCRILIMSQHDPVQLLPRAIEAGANACVDKSSLYQDLAPAIASVLSNVDVPPKLAGSAAPAKTGT